MSLFEKTLERVEVNKYNLQKGIFNGIPYGYPRLNEYITSIDKGQAIGVLGATGIGKSKFTRKTFLYDVYKFYKETGYKCRVLFFCLEDSKEKTMQFVMCHYLKEVHDITITIKELNSKGRELPNFVLEALKKGKEYFKEFETIVSFIDGVTEPTEIYKICEGIAKKLGKTESYIENIEGEEIKQKRYVSDTHVIAIFDNMSNIDMGDEDGDEQKAILRFVRTYMRLRLVNFCQWTCIMVMQLDFESERQSFGKDGHTNVAKLEPSLASIGDSKRASRSFHLIFSLFSPARYDIISYPQPTKANPDNYYRIDILGNRFRSLRIIKSNETDVGMRVGLLFNGITEEFEELPIPKDKEALDTIYKRFDGAKFTKSKKLIINEGEVEEQAPF